MNRVELLLPAKDAAVGRIAVNHGADAVYIGASRFGARQAAGNGLSDIEQLVRYAHLYGVNVYVTINTVLFEHELRAVEQLTHQLYDMGVDALIVQDMGILKLDLPPVALHASTQCHNADLHQIRFLEKAGFKRAILAREMGLEQIRQIRVQSDMQLEMFVHGALCVSYSGQCYMSKCTTDRSGNRGECAQVCRMRYHLQDADGKTLLRDKHLLSLPDMNRSESLLDILQAGVCSLKVEGRLKDASYVKNITAYYRQKLDAILEEHPEFQKTSSGKTTFFFQPDPNKSFSRGFTDYFLNDQRRSIASFDTPKAMGEKIGFLSQDRQGRIVYQGGATITNGDGLCFINADDTLEGFLVNKVEGCVIVPHKPVSLIRKVEVFRNLDRDFEKHIAEKSAERKVFVDVCFEEAENGFVLTLEDVDGVCVSAVLETGKMPAQKPEMAMKQIAASLVKFGSTPFAVAKLAIQSAPYFLSPSILNKLRNEAVEQLKDARMKHFMPAESTRQYAPEKMFETVDYKRNVTNSLSESVYRDFGAQSVERGLDVTKDFKGRQLMVCKHCLRFELGCCSKNSTKPTAKFPWFLNDGRHRFRLDFDCRNCQMKILAE